MKQMNYKKLIIPNIPYVFFVYLFDKVGQAVRLAPGADISEKILNITQGFSEAFSNALPSVHPLDLLIGIVGAVVIRLIVYVKGKNAKKYRKGAEYGSARWGNAEDIKPYIDPDFQNNIILTQTERLTMNSRPKQPKYARNKNVVVIGGSGSGKTRFFVKPNLMQLHSSYVLTDPKGTVLIECGKLLQRGGYKIKVLNTINFKKSMRYNPFVYIRSEKDVLKVVNTLIVNTKGEGEKSAEDFWVKAERLLYCALIGYIWYEAPAEEMNFTTLLELINASEAREDDEEYQSPVDLLFADLEERSPDHFAVKQYKKYKLAAGADGYTITECERAGVGTDIIMHIKPDTEDEKYGEFLESWRLQELVRKYSDYIRFPIRMEVSKTRRKEGSPDDKPEYETYQEVETLNSMVPIWQRRKSSVKPEEYNKFYRDKFHDYTDPQRVIAVSAEGAVTYKALLFIPGATPYDYYTKEYERGLQLYANGVLIMDKCADLLPEHFRFVRGVVDSPDLSLNISRELLQHDRQLKVIAANLEKKIKAELGKLLKDDREGYEKFWKNFGRQLKYGTVSEYGAHKDLLSDLLLFYSSTEKKPVTLAEYVSRMKEDQKYLYYAAGESLDKIDKLPQTELLKDAGTEILYFTEDVDEFCAQTLRTYQDKEFRSVLDQELEEGAQKKAQEAADAHKAAFDFVKEALGDAVKEVRASTRLKSHPVCLTAGEGLSFEMEKYFQAVQPDMPLHADRILELNVEHPAFAALEAAVTADPEKARKYASLLYNQALLIAGLPLEDPSGYTDLVCELMK